MREDSGLTKFDLFHIGFEEVAKSPFVHSPKLMDFLQDVVLLILKSMDEEEMKKVRGYLKESDLLDEDGKLKRYVVKGYLPRNPEKLDLSKVDEARLYFKDPDKWDIVLNDIIEEIDEEK